MFHVKNHKQLNMFDPWSYLGPKRVRELNTSWAGLFRNTILPVLPVDALREFYHHSAGRPTKEIYSMLGMMILQQMFDLTDEQTVEQFAFNIKWHYALDITSSLDAYSYVSLRTIWEIRHILSSNNLHDVIFQNCTEKLAKAFNVDLKKQRIDSVHIQSNMRHLGRISLFSHTVKKFLLNLKRHHRGLFDRVDTSLRSRYLSKKEEAVFALVKPSQSGQTLQQLAQDVFELVTTFTTNELVSSMVSFKHLIRLFQEQCITEEHDGEKLVLAKPNKEVPSDSLQNSSDPDAGYSGHKGQGYSVQVMETYSPDNKDKNLPLLTYINVQSANNSDAHALIPAIDATREQCLDPAEVLADAAYGSDENVVKAEKEYGVEIVSPLKNQPKGLSISNFELDESGNVIKCPQGKVPDRTRFKKRYSALFSNQCDGCPRLEECPVKSGKKGRYLRYTTKDVRIAKRRCYERIADFKDKYRFRAGVEATMSEYDRRTGVKKLRVRGRVAVTFAATMKAIGVNIKRAAAFIRHGKNTEYSPNRKKRFFVPQNMALKEQKQTMSFEILACFGLLRPNVTLMRKVA